MALLSSFQLPSSTLVNVNIPKNLLKRHDFADALLDDILVQNGKTQLFDRALIAPRTCAIPVFQDESHLYDEIHIFELTVKQIKSLDNLEEKLFSAMPYPLVLIAHYQEESRLSLAHFRTNAADKSQNVLTDRIHSRWFNDETFPLPLSYTSLPKTNLYIFYSAIFDAIVMDNARQLWPDYIKDAQTARIALRLFQIYDKQRNEASAALKREKQMHHCLEYNRKLISIQKLIDQIPLHSANELSECIAQYAPNLA